jgi:hypothetical protein
MWHVYFIGHLTYSVLCAVFAIWWQFTIIFLSVCENNYVINTFLVGRFNDTLKEEEREIAFWDSLKNTNRSPDNEQILPPALPTAQSFENEMGRGRGGTRGRGRAVNGKCEGRFRAVHLPDKIECWREKYLQKIWYLNDCN